MKQKLQFSLGIINIGAAQSELFLCWKTPLFTKLLTSYLGFTLCTFGIGNSLAWYGWALSRSLVLYSVAV